MAPSRALHRLVLFWVAVPFVLRFGDELRVPRILGLAALLPVQFVLLRFGEPHGATDAVGVLVTIGQWLAVRWALGPTGEQEPSEGLSGSDGLS